MDTPPEQSRSFLFRLVDIAGLFRGDFKELTLHRKLTETGDVISFIYSFPGAIAGLIWLFLETNPDVIKANLPFVLLNFLLIYIFSRLSFFIILELRTDRYGTVEESLATMIQWSAVFVIGPTALWLIALFLVTLHLIDFFKTRSIASKWNSIGNLSLSLAINIFATMISLKIYRLLSGKFPIEGLELRSILTAMAALSLHLLLAIVLWIGYVFYHIRVQKLIGGSYTTKPLIRFFMLSLGLPFIAHPFAIFLAGIYVQNGYIPYLFLTIGFLIVALLGRQLSWNAENVRQQAKQLEKLEKLSRALLNAVPDLSVLPAILKEHIPNMFPSGYIAIWIEPDTIIIAHPEDHAPIDQRAWEWLTSQKIIRSILSRESLPWDRTQMSPNAIIMTPIHIQQQNKTVGGIYLELRALVQPWDEKSLKNMYPALQTLADQIASILHQNLVYEQSVEYKQLTQELKLAGQIQASFLPNIFPVIPGWQLAVTLLPARETSGDFFDVIQLEGGRLGIIIADVADKGIGSALYMALSRTLLRTYAEEYEADPEVVFFAANNRLLRDARANLFVTSFYGILDPVEGSLTYCNAGHNPPFLLRNTDDKAVESLSRTGIAIGIEPNSTWNKETVNIHSGDILILYTDGIPDAQNSIGSFFDCERMINVARENSSKMAYEIQSAIIEEIQKFVGDAPQTDDITLMILSRDR